MSNGSIEQTLQERGNQYGAFSEHARISQNIIRAFKDSRNWDKLDDDMREALHIISNKIGRILNGNPHFHDSWHDIVGYAKLVADRLAVPSTSDPYALPGDYKLHDGEDVNQQIQMIWGTPVGEITDE